jgi:hypothetical protein
MIPPNNIRCKLVRGLSPRAYWATVARNTDYLFLAALSNLFSRTELAELRKVDAEIDEQVTDTGLRIGTQKHRVLRALELGYVNSNHIAAITNLPLPTVSAWLSVLCKEHKVEKFKEANVNVNSIARVTHFYRLLLEHP